MGDSRPISSLSIRSGTSPIEEPGRQHLRSTELLPDALQSLVVGEYGVDHSVTGLVSLTSIERPQRRRKKGDGMTIEIPNSVRQAATECQYNFGDHSGGDCGARTMCDVSYSPGNRVLVLTAETQATCPYSIDYGHDQICTCPVRAYLHDFQHSRFG